METKRRRFFGFKILLGWFLFQAFAMENWRRGEEGRNCEVDLAEE